MSIFMTARFKVKPQAEESCRQAIREFVEGVGAEEPGTHFYTSLAQTASPTDFLHVFSFADDAARRAHETSAAVRRFTDALYPELEGEVEFTSYGLVAASRDLGAGGYDILHQLSIKASPAEVYRAVTVGEQLAGWWTRDCEAEAKAGSVARFCFNQRAVVFEMRIDELEPDRRVSWYCLDGHPEWKDTTLAFDIRPAANGSVLVFAHRGWRSTSGVYAICSFDWARYLTSLRSLVETGEGNPHQG